MMKILKKIIIINKTNFSAAEVANELEEVCFGKTMVMSSFKSNIANKQKDEIIMGMNNRMLNADECKQLDRSGKT